MHATRICPPAGTQLAPSDERSAVLTPRGAAALAIAALEGLLCQLEAADRAYAVQMLGNLVRLERQAALVRELVDGAGTRA